MRSIEELIELDDNSIQRILMCLDNDLLSASLIKSSAALKEVIFRNMSKRAADMIRSEMNLIGKVSSEKMKECHANFLKLCNDVLAGRVVPEKEKKKLRADDKLRARLKAKSISEMTPTELGRVLEEFSTLARVNGILSLETLISEVCDSFLALGLSLTVDGTDPDLV